MEKPGIERAMYKSGNITKIWWKMWPKYEVCKNDQNEWSVMERSEQRRKGQCFVRFAFGRRSSLFLCSCPFLVSMFAVGLCVLWVLCGPSKATARCYTSICGILYIYFIFSFCISSVNICKYFDSVRYRLRLPVVHPTWPIKNKNKKVHQTWPIRK